MAQLNGAQNTALITDHLLDFTKWDYAASDVNKLLGWKLRDFAGYGTIENWQNHLLPWKFLHHSFRHEEFDKIVVANWLVASIRDGEMTMNHQRQVTLVNITKANKFCVL